MPETTDNLTILTTPKSLGKDYYACKKPRCFGCIEQGIAESEYKFCSQEKASLTILDEGGKKVVAVFENVYQCQVYHGTIYQGTTNKAINKTN